QRLRQRAHHQRLAGAGHALDEDMPSGEEGDQDLVDGLMVSDDDPADLVAHTLEALLELAHRLLRCLPGHSSGLREYTRRTMSSYSGGISAFRRASSWSCRLLSAAGAEGPATATPVVGIRLPGGCGWLPFCSTARRKELSVTLNVAGTSAESAAPGASES